MADEPKHRARPTMATRVVNAFAIGAFTAFLTAVPSLLFAVVIMQSDDAVLGALAIALSAGMLAVPVAFWRLSRVPAIEASAAAERRGRL